MSDLVPTEDIERIVGASRHPIHHLGRAVLSEQRGYILHSQACLELHQDPEAHGYDLTGCFYSQKLDLYGVDPESWPEDVPVRLYVDHFGLLCGEPLEPSDDDRNLPKGSE